MGRIEDGLLETNFYLPWLKTNLDRKKVKLEVYAYVKVHSSIFYCGSNVKTLLTI